MSWLETDKEVEVFKYLGVLHTCVWLDRKMKGSVKMERVRVKAEEWVGKTKGMNCMNINVLCSIATL